MRQSKRRKMASLDAMDVATRFVNAANQHDPDSLVACVHRDFQSIQPVHPDRNFRGVGQLRNNWEAIFRTEPGFRLTVLRATATEDTVWMELHGAGDDEEAAGTFILGVENGRIRWVRVYSDIVQAPPDHLVEDPAAALAEVPPPAQKEDDKWAAVVTDDTPIAAMPEAENASVADSAVEEAAAERAESANEHDDVDVDVEVTERVDPEDAPGSETDDEPAYEPGAEASPDADHEPRKNWRRLLRGKAKS